MGLRVFSKIADFINAITADVDAALGLSGYHVSHAGTRLLVIGQDGCHYGVGIGTDTIWRHSAGALIVMVIGLWRAQPTNYVGHG